MFRLFQYAKFFKNKIIIENYKIISLNNFDVICINPKKDKVFLEKVKVSIEICERISLALTSKLAMLS